MPVDWKAPDSFNRLLAATVASMDGQMKLNYKRIADFYGDGATYDAIEGRFRIIKKEAQKLRDEVDGGRSVAPARGGGTASNGSTPKKPRTPKKPDNVMNGRVTKCNHASPTKKSTNTHIKTEVLESSTSNSTTSSYTDADTPASSADNCGTVEDSFRYEPTLANFDMNLDGATDTGTDHYLSQILLQGDYWDSEHIV